MDEPTSLGSGTDKPPSQQTFRFAGVELRPEESPQDKIRGLARVSLWTSSVRSILVGTAVALAFLWVEKSVVDHDSVDYTFQYGHSSHPDPFPYISHGLLFFYIGWALYWGLHDCVNADAMDEQHRVNRSLGGFLGGAGTALPWMAWLGGHAVGVLVYAVGAVMIAAITIYSLLGGGIYGFCKAVRQSRK